MRVPVGIRCAGEKTLKRSTCHVVLVQVPSVAKLANMSTANVKHGDAVRTEHVPEKFHIVDESRLDTNIHLNDAINAEIDKDEKRVRRIMRKVDFRMVPILGLLYMWALIDRVNLPNVR